MTASNDFHILIPARMASTRLPEKAMADLDGQPMVVRVWQRALEAGGQSVHVVTDHPSIQLAVESLGGSVVMTREDHASGTDRLCEAVEQLGIESEAIIVNLQGDEPLMPIICLRQVAQLLKNHPLALMATLYDELDTQSEWFSPDVVKVLVDDHQRALCFSRSPIPYFRGRSWSSDLAKRHVGLYAYRASALSLWPTLPPSLIEQAESLEQWRALSAGWHVVAEQAQAPIPTGIDSADDLARVRAILVAESGSRARE